MSHPGVASAHATLVSSDPADGSRLKSSPAQVRLVFDEAVGLSSDGARVISSTGADADSGSARLDNGTTVVIPLKPDLPRGSYSATWRVVSADSHIVTGSISFGIGQDAAAAPPTSALDRSRALTTADSVAQGLLYAGLVGGFGVPIVASTLWGWTLARRRVRAAVGGGWVLMVGATFVQFAVAGPRERNLGWGAVFESGSFSAALDGDGAVLPWRLALIVVAAVPLSLLVRSRAPTVHRWPLIGSAVLAAAVAVTIAVDGHAGVGADAVPATIATAAHIGAMMCWLGGLALLVTTVLPARRTENLARWSLVGFGCVSVLILSGEYQSYRQVRPLESLWGTDYGVALLIKLTLVAAMLVAAFVGNRGVDWSRLRWTVPLEAALGVAVIVVTTILVSQPPARTTYGPPIDVTAPLDSGRSVHIEIGDSRRGATTVSITPERGDGAPLAASSVTATLASEDAGIASLPVRLTPDGGAWRSTYTVVPLPGVWKLQMTVGFTESDAVVTSTSYRVW